MEEARDTGEPLRSRGSAMGDILQAWIQARLGIMIDLGPKVFGHYTKDGRLLAQILHSYDIISRDQLDTIMATHDPALCRVNLKHLRFWLRFLGIECDQESIEEISCGNGTASLRLFYKVYLCLETRDRLCSYYFFVLNFYYFYQILIRASRENLTRYAGPICYSIVLFLTHALPFLR